MRFFDTHTHLDYLAETTGQSVATLVENANQVGVAQILVVAVMAANFERVIACQRAEPQKVVYGLGLHPLYIAQHQRADLDTLAQHFCLGDPHCVAVAEIGLERAIPALCAPEYWRKQLDFLTAQLALAKQFALPVNLHSRQSHEPLSPLLKQADLPKTGVVHGFAGSYAQAKRFVDLGYKIGVGGTITYARANKTRQAIRQLPLNALVLETDSPDMPVFGFQGQPNRPERLGVTFQALCDLRPEPPEIIAEQLWANSQIFAPNLPATL